MDIDFSKLSRNYKEQPFKRYETLNREDLVYLYLTLNLSRKQITEIIGCSIPTLDKFFKSYKIEKSHYLWNEQRKKTYTERYGVDNFSKIENFGEIVKEKCLQKYGVDSTNKLESVKSKKEKTYTERYGALNPSQVEDIQKKKIATSFKRYGEKHFVNSEKAKETNLKRYGFENPSQVPQFQEKRKETNLALFGDTCFLSSDIGKRKVKEACLKKYGVTNPTLLEEFVEKGYQTKKRNGTLNTSKQEDRIYELLTQKFPDVKRQYRDKRYPYACDFYIPSQDLFIEYQGTWTHGQHPYNKYNNQDLKLVELWQQQANELNFKGKAKFYYLNALKVWTKTDPKKREVALKNKLNWLEFFNEQEFKDWFEKI